MCAIIIKSRYLPRPTIKTFSFITITVTNNIPSRTAIAVQIDGGGGGLRNSDGGAIGSGSGLREGSDRVMAAGGAVVDGTTNVSSA